MSDAGTDAATDTATEQPQALPGDGLREGIVDALRSALGERLIDTHLVPQTDLWVRVAPDAWADVAAALKQAGFDYFCFLSAIDWMPSPYGRGEDDPEAEPTEPSTEIRQGVTGGETRFQVFARVTDIDRHVGVTIKADVPESMSMPTWIPWYAGANWHERETHEMFGIGFDGHPDLRNLYLPGEFEGFPLRKDFPLLARMIKPWPGIVDVEPMPAQEGDETASEDASGTATEVASGSAGEVASGTATEVSSGSASEDASGTAGEDASGTASEDASETASEDGSS